MATNSLLHVWCHTQLITWLCCLTCSVDQLQIEFRSLSDCIKVFWKYKQVLAIVSLSYVKYENRKNMWHTVSSLPGVQETGWKLCLTQPHPESFCVLSVQYSCKFCLDRDCRIELSVLRRNGFNLYVNMARQQFGFAWWPLKPQCSFAFCNTEGRYMGKSHLWKLGNKLWVTYNPFV